MSSPRTLHHHPQSKRETTPDEVSSPEEEKEGVGSWSYEE